MSIALLHLVIDQRKSGSHIRARIQALSYDLSAKRLRVLLLIHTVSAGEKMWFHVAISLYAHFGVLLYVVRSDLFDEDMFFVRSFSSVFSGVVCLLLNSDLD